LIDRLKDRDKMLKEILVPDIGSFSNVEIIEVSVAPGDILVAEATMITLETDKATLEIPAPAVGVVKEVRVNVGDKVSEGSVILMLEVEEASTSSTKEAEKPSAAKVEQTAVEGIKPSVDAQAAKTELEPAKSQSNQPPTASALPNVLNQSEEVRASSVSHASVHAGPKVRRFARELGVDLALVQATGPKNRILQGDVQAFVKQALSQGQSSGSTGTFGGLSIPSWPSVDHAKFGPIQVESLSRIKKLSGSYLHRNWVLVPHVTQFDEADITELEQFRKDQGALVEQQGVKLTPLVFIMKAVVVALKAFHRFNASLDANGTQLILKGYFHIGVAVDTPNGLVVPVVRDVDQKGLFQLAKELAEISQKARLGQLTAQDMQGSSFSISSLGGIGGTAFTPIINVPDVAILGVSKSQIKPVFQEGEFKPRLMLPLSLSYDHRVIDGAEAARFTSFLVKQLSDIRRLLL
jgi:pyruvate dehydrogenase E2 component (dihydrolipoamide acetyltransferase)